MLSTKGQYPDLIQAFNARLQGRGTTIKGLDDENEANKDLTPIANLAERATLNSNNIIND